MTSAFMLIPVIAEYWENYSFDDGRFPEGANTGGWHIDNNLVIGDLIGINEFKFTSKNKFDIFF
jgi:hypothetical protein